MSATSAMTAMNLQSPLTAGLTAAVNHLLSRQPQLSAALAAHAGKSATIDAGLQRFCWQVAADGLLQAAQAEPASVTISIAPADLPLIMANPERAVAHVHLSGDADFARAISEVATGLRWDAEADLSHVVGDIAAVRIVQVAKSMAAELKSGGRKLAENIAEYLLEENPMLLYRRAGDDFASDVAVLRDDVERLSKRIALLEKQAEGKHAGVNDD